MPEFDNSHKTQANELKKPVKTLPVGQTPTATESQPAIVIDDVPAATPTFNYSTISALIFISLASTIVIVLIVKVFRWLTFKPKQPTKRELRKNYNRLELSEDHQRIVLYRRHQVAADKHIKVSDIMQCMVMLNNRQLCLLDNKQLCSFSNQQETLLRAELSNEYRQKMLPNKVRYIYLKIIAQTGSYTISLYMRIGNQRLTQSSYQQIIEQLMNWCWFIGQQLSHTKLEDRTVHRQSIAAAFTEQNVNNSFEFMNRAKALVASTENNKQNKMLATDVQSESLLSPKINSFEQDSQLINALEKLALLAEQGYLDEQEFIAAKQKLMRDLLYE